VLLGMRTEELSDAGCEARLQGVQREYPGPEALVAVVVVVGGPGIFVFRVAQERNTILVVLANYMENFGELKDRHGLVLGVLAEQG